MLYSVLTYLSSFRVPRYTAALMGKPECITLHTRNSCYAWNTGRDAENLRHTLLVKEKVRDYNNLAYFREATLIACPGDQAKWNREYTRVCWVLLSKIADHAVNLPLSHCMSGLAASEFSELIILWYLCMCSYSTSVSKQINSLDIWSCITLRLKFGLPM